MFRHVFRHVLRQVFRHALDRYGLSRHGFRHVFRYVLIHVFRLVFRHPTDSGAEEGTKEDQADMHEEFKQALVGANLTEKDIYMC